MPSSKILALCVLFFSPFAQALVQFNSTIEFESPWRKYKDSKETEIRLNPLELAIIANDFAVKVEAYVFAEQVDKVTVQYFVSMSNSDGYELMSNPVICVEYGQIVTVYEYMQYCNGKQLDSFKVKIVATQLE